MATPLDDVSCARLPRDVLPALAPLRCAPGVRAEFVGECVWLRWRAGDDAVLSSLLPLDGVQLFAQRDGLWFRPGRRLPASDVPPLGEGLPLDQVLFPVPVTPEESPQSPGLRPVTLTLVPDGRPRPTTGLICSAEALLPWAARATTAELEAVEAAHCDGRVFLLGATLPALAGGVRLWGRRVLMPLGFRPEPELSEESLRTALGVSADELLLLDHDGAEAVMRDAFRPLSRAAIRAFAGEAS